MRGGRRTRSPRSLGVDRKTVRKYIAPAVAAGIVPGRAAGERGGVGGAGAGVVPAAGRYPAAAGDLAGDRGASRYITAQLEAGVRMATIHQRLRDERGLAVSVASFRRYVAANLPEETRRSQVRVLTRARLRPGSRRRSITGSWAGGWTR